MCLCVCVCKTNTYPELPLKTLKVMNSKTLVAEGVQVKVVVL